MQAPQKQRIEAFARVRAFIDKYPASGPITYRSAREALETALQRVAEHAGTQMGAPAQRRAETVRQREHIRCLLDDFMRPIATIARAQIAPGSDVGLPVALRLPRGFRSVSRMLIASDAMIEMARPFEALLIEHGMPEDFLTRFAEARERLAESTRHRVTHGTAGVSASAGLKEELRRARLAVDRLDAVVRTAFANDPMMQVAWRSAKRVHLLPRRTVRAAASDVSARLHDEVGRLRAA